MLSFTITNENKIFTFVILDLAVSQSVGRHVRCQA